VQGPTGQRNFKGKPSAPPETTGETVMTQPFEHAPEQSSINTVVVGVLMSAVIVLAGLLSFAPYSLI
jgi:hypothetical protein